MKYKQSKKYMGHRKRPAYTPEARRRKLLLRKPVEIYLESDYVDESGKAKVHST